MLTLHLAYFQKQFVFWGETPLERLELDTDRLYPYQAPLTELHQVLSTLTLSKSPEALHTLNPWLWTPSTEERSSAAAAPLIGQESQLRPWRLEAIKLPPGKVIQWLKGFGHKQMPLGTVCHGVEIAYWHNLLRLAASLAWRGALLPDLEREESAWLATWNPLLDENDHRLLTDLAAHLPGVTMALSTNPEQAPSRQARKLLLQALQTLCDSLVRIQPVGPEPHLKRSRNLSATDSWLQALRRRNAKVQGQDWELQALSRHIQAWTSPLRLMAEAPFQVVFQLEEPNETSETWYLRFLLQDRDDPSLLLPLELGLSSRNEQPEVLRAHHYVLRDFIGRALRRAIEHYPFLENMNLKYPAGLELGQREVESFLSQSTHLESAGFGLRLPSWWLQGAPGIKGKASFQGAQSASSGHFSLNSLIDANWHLMLGDEDISLEELRELAALKSHLVQWRGRWIRVDSNKLQKALDFWQEQQGQMRFQDLLQLGPQGEGAPFELEHIEMDQNLQTFLAELHGKEELAEIPVSEEFQGSLRAYQQRGLNWLVFLCSHGLGACLADDMGLGKTIQTLAMLQFFFLSGEKRPVLLICPTSLLSNWWHEAQRFVPKLRILTHHGADRDKSEDFHERIFGHEIVITTYALAHRDFAFLNEVAWAGIILDEAQNIKNPQTKQSQAIRRLSANWRLALTGTPMENHVGDLWTIMDFLNRGLLGSQATFKRRFLTPIHINQDAVAMAQLQHLSNTFVLRRSKQDPDILPELPPKQEMKVYCTLTREQASLYAATVQEIEQSLSKLNGMQRRGLILASLTRLKQICNHPLHFLKQEGKVSKRSGKLSRLEEMLAEIIESQEKSLIFTQYAEMGKILSSYLHEHFKQEVLFLYGGTPAHKRAEMIAHFQSNHHCPIFVLSLKAGGVGLNLTAANHVFHFDRWWNPAVENQATDRAHRIGQERTVQVHKLICAGTLEERIDQMIEEKQGLAEQIVGSGENWITELSDQEVKELFQLNQELVYG